MDLTKSPTLWTYFSSSWDEVVHFMDFNKVVQFMDINNKLVHFVDLMIFHPPGMKLSTLWT